MKHALYGLIRSSDTAKARISELLMSIEIAEKEKKKRGKTEQSLCMPWNDINRSNINTIGTL